MKTSKSVNTKLTSFSFPAILILLMTIYTAGCQNDNVSDPSYLSDDEYLRTLAVNSAFSNDTDDDDNLFAGEVDDFDSGGPVTDNSGEFDTPIDSLIKWGRRVTGVTVNAEISQSSDTMKTVRVTRTISGNFIIVGWVNGVHDSVAKPYTQQQKREMVFKRVARKQNPRHNWRVYEHTAVDGQTTSPQEGKSNIVIYTAEIYKNGQLALTLTGPDFTSNRFISRFFGGTGTLELNPGDQVKIRIMLTSNQSDTDHVSFHWSRNSFGFHRESFELVSQTPGGTGFERIFEKTFTVYPQHMRGIHNGFISANTRKSLYDNDPALFSSTYFGLPYRVRF